MMYILGEIILLGIACVGLYFLLGYISQPLLFFRSIVLTVLVAGIVVAWLIKGMTGHK